MYLSPTHHIFLALSPPLLAFLKVHHCQIDFIAETVLAEYVK